MNRRTFLSVIAASALAVTHTSRAADQADMTGDDPMKAAEYLSLLESFTYIPSMYQLYDYMHPDAKKIVPRATVIGWYSEDFNPRGPKPATATGVQWLDSWTWPVSGVAYSNVAEVSYTQEFADGSVDNDVVRLVQRNGEWKWFFGRSQSWVEEQNDRFDQLSKIGPAGNAPLGLDVLTSLNFSLVGELPTTLYSDVFKTNYGLDDLSADIQPGESFLPSELFRYKAINPPSEFPLGTVELGGYLNMGTAKQQLEAIATITQNQPPVEIIGWNSEPSTGLPWLYAMKQGVDVIGDSYEFYLMSETAYLRIWMMTEEALGEVAATLAGTT
ncbi:MAG: hypothetical protein KC435_10030 [Thermomicrobiales bacterium]|nr:hypothetical protein [Thermomicrobiales bacterium]